jgi:hypothetical protein
MLLVAFRPCCALTWSAVLHGLSSLRCSLIRVKVRRPWLLRCAAFSPDRSYACCSLPDRNLRTLVM